MDVNKKSKVFSVSDRPILMSNIFFLAILLISIFVPRILSPILYLKLGLSQPVALITSHFILFVLPAIVYIIVTKQSFKEVLRLNKVGIKEVFLALLIAFIAQPVMAFFSYIASFFVNNDVAVMLDTLSKTPLWLMILMIGVTPAISEEITMRGIVLSGYKFKNKHIAALMSGLMFGILHLNLHQFLYAFAMGMIFAYLVMATNSIIPAMIAHFTINTSQLILQRVVLSLQDNLGGAVDVANAGNTLKEMPMALKLGMGAFYFVIALVGSYIIMLIINYLEKSRLKAVGSNISDRESNGMRSINIEKVINIPIILIITVYVLYMFLRLG